MSKQRRTSKPARRTTTSKVGKPAPKRSQSVPAKAASSITRRSTGNVGRSKPGRAKPRRALPGADQSHSARPHGRHEIECIARALITLDSRVLLCQNIAKGNYYLPGGHVEFGEPAARAAERELLEEAGLKIRIVRPPLLVDEHSFHTRKRLHHELNVVFPVEPPANASERRAWEAVRSREDHIRLVWVELAAVVDLPILPMSAKAFLIAAHGSPGTQWVSDMASPNR